MKYIFILLISIVFISEITAAKGTQKMKIIIKANNKAVIFELNNSNAAKDFYAQLPLSIQVEDFANNEKIFYPPKKLNTSATPMANAKTGTLAYYSPWGDIVMFYKNFGSATGLFELGNAISGTEHIKGISGTINIDYYSE